MFTTKLIEKVLQKNGIQRVFKPAIISTVSLDSRKCYNNSMFFAFSGENTDGHHFIPELLKKGVYCVGEKDMPEDEKYIKVPSVIDFLSDMAKERRKLFKGKVIAVTGSSGKTSTRQLIVSMLSLLGKTIHAASGNLNNHIGLPVVLLNTPLQIDYIVLEMGMNHAGEIRNLVGIADPDYSIITNIGNAHIGNFNSQSELADAKIEIFEFSKGVALADIGNKYISEWVNNNRNKHKILEYSMKNLDIFKENLSSLSDFMVENLFTASMVLKAAENVLPNMEKVILNLVLPQMRGEIRKIRNRMFVVDCYNANPDSMKRSVESFYKKYSNDGNDKIYLILGSMFELGNFSKKMHEELVKYLKNFNLIEGVFLIGCEFDKIKTSFLNEKKVFFLGGIDELEHCLPESGIFLIKGSRGNKLERIFDILEEKGGKN